MHEIKRISAEETRELRHLVLRKGQPRHTTIYPEDQEPEAFHLGLFHKDILQCIGSFYADRNDLFKNTAQYRLRGMATHPDFRSKGFGKSLIEHALSELRSLKIEILWCNARTSAAGYYEKIGFQSIGPLFDIPNIGPHVVMFKAL